MLHCCGFARTIVCKEIVIHVKFKPDTVHEPCPQVTALNGTDLKFQKYKTLV